MTSRPKRSERSAGKSAPRRKDQRVRDQGDWRQETLARMRSLILEAHPGILEERKWRKPSNAMAGIPVWSHDGIVCTGETYAKVVKLTFARGAAIPDPSRLFNASLKGGTRRAIDIREGEKINARAFKALVRSAVANNRASALERLGSRTRAGKARRTNGPKRGKVVLLSGGNPQIAKADGDEPVQAYIAAMPGWKHDVGKRLDALIVRAVPNVRKAVKWNSPFYGVDGRGWFLSFHVFTRYVKVTFFRGTSLRPVPPGGTGKEARWIDIHEDGLDRALMSAWVKQAAKLPGWAP